jgi:transposase
MDLHAELERVMADSASSGHGGADDSQTDRSAQKSAAEQIARRDTELFAAQTKIQALTLELAHLRRMRFGVKSEALDAETRDLFQETLASDVAAAEAELARRQAEAEETPAARGQSVIGPAANPCLSI